MPIGWETVVCYRNRLVFGAFAELKRDGARDCSGRMHAGIER